MADAHLETGHIVQMAILLPEFTCPDVMSVTCGGGTDLYCIAVNNFIFMNKKIIIAISIVAVLLLILVFGIGMLVGIKMRSKTSSGQENTFQAGWDAAKERLEKIGIGVLPANTEIKSMAATVQKISGDSMIVKAISTMDPLSDPSLDTRTIQINNNTKFYRLVQKDSAQLQKEMEDFRKNNPGQSSDSLSQSADYPVPQEKKETGISDIKEGSDILILSNGDIRDKKEFLAVEILLQPIATVPTTSNAAQNVPVSNSK
jgi:hypothetical protein